jgi:hypothetical protein
MVLLFHLLSHVTRLGTKPVMAIVQKSSIITTHRYFSNSDDGLSTVYLLLPQSTSTRRGDLYGERYVEGDNVLAIDALTGD